MRLKLFLITLFLKAFQVTFAKEYFKATSNLNVRTGPSKVYPVSFGLQKGDEVILVQSEANWYKIEYLGRTGYASSKYLIFSRNVPDQISNTQSDSNLINTVIIIAFIILGLFFGLTFYRKIQDNELLQSVTDKYRGTKSERDLVLALLKVGVSNKYIFHDLYVEKRKDEFSQTDLVLLTRVGIIVIEVKDYSGWIFGSGNKSQWTKVLAYGKQKYYFYNPIKQNDAHITEIKRQLYKFEDIPFYSIIVFYGECELKNIDFVPIGAYIVKAERILEVLGHILSENPQYNYINEKEVIRILSKAVLNGGILKNQIRHSENIQDMLGKNRVYD